MTNIQQNKDQATSYFRDLRNRICVALENIEQESGSTVSFQRTSWDRPEGGGGQMSIMQGGQIFEKAGVNISTVFGEFSSQFQKEIPGADIDPNFWASGISLVIHPRSPMVPIVHMNCRYICTTKSWFGGGADLTPVFPVEQDTNDFHAAFKQACDKHNPTYYPEFKKYCDEYFFLKHRNEPRGIGGIFFDYHNTGNFAADFDFVKDVGECFLNIYPQLVRRNMGIAYTEEHKAQQLVKRGRYVEFNLIYDRGTRFGLMTGGNTEAILMSLPPVATW